MYRGPPFEVKVEKVTAVEFLKEPVISRVVPGFVLPIPTLPAIVVLPELSTVNLAVPLVLALIRGPVEV